jgi:hypothetical protein
MLAKLHNLSKFIQQVAERDVHKPTLVTYMETSTVLSFQGSLETGEIVEFSSQRKTHEKARMLEVS